MMKKKKWKKVGRAKYVLRNPGKRDKRTEVEAFTEAEAFEENSKLNPRLHPAKMHAVDGVTWYMCRIGEILGGLERVKAGQALRLDELYAQLGLAEWREVPRCDRSVLSDTIAFEREWCGLAMDRLEKDTEIIITYKGGHGRVRLATAEDRERLRREQAEDERRDAEKARVAQALGKNTAYDDKGVRSRRKTTTGRVIFEGPAYRKLVKLLEREGLLKKE